MHIDREHFRKLEETFYAALELEDGPEREAYVSELCSEDSETGEQLRELLSSRRDVIEAAGPISDSLPRFGAWQAIRVLGRGGMGTVYLAERADGAFEMSAAVKVVPLAIASPDIEERFLKERQFLAMLEHPGISRLIDGGVSQQGVPFLVMEYIDGEPVDRHAERKGLATRERVALMRQIMAALAYVHSQRVLHRDLKPSNILVDAQGRVKLLDFGIARLMTAETAGAATNPTIAMTPDYASPEQVRGERLTAAADVYSAGLVMHRLLTGRLPSRDAKHAPGLARPLREIIARATAAKPADRYSSAEAMDADLGRYLDGAPVSGTAEARHRRLLWAGSVACVAAAVIALSLWFSARPAQARAAVAVLPFRSASADDKDRYVSEGIADEIRTGLERAKPLLVISRQSSAAFGASIPNPREIGKKLQASHIVEGSVARNESDIQVVVRLEKTSDGSRLWEKTYKRAKTDLYRLQQDITRDVARSLHAETAIAASKHVVTNQEAINLLMRARFEAEQFKSAGFIAAEEDARRAIAIDPEYAAAYYVLGATVINHGSSLHDLEGHRKVIREGISYYEKALELDPDLVPPRVNLAGLKLQETWDWKGAEAEYRRALAGGPNAAANTAYGYLLTLEGRFEQASECFKSAQEQNAYSVSQMINIAGSLVNQRRYDEALQIYHLLIERKADEERTRSAIDFIYVLQGKGELALADYDRHPSTSPLAKMQRAQALAFLGKSDAAVALIRPMEAEYRAYMPATSFAAVYARFDAKQAVGWLKRAADDHDYALLSIGVSPVFDPIRGEPGFQAILRRIGLGR